VAPKLPAPTGAEIEQALSDLETTSPPMRQWATDLLRYAVIEQSRRRQVKLSEILARVQPVNPRHRAFIRHWRRLPGVDQMWINIQNAAERHGLPLLDAGAFVAVVLSAAWPPIEHIIAWDKQVKSEFEKLKGRIIEDIKEASTPNELRLIIGTVLPEYDDEIFALSKSSYDFNSPPVSRKDQDDSRNRIAFAHRIGSYLERRCGERRDVDVATLVDRAFPGVSSTDQVRLARRARTKASRKRRRRKKA